MTNAFDKIAAGLADAIAYAEGDTTRGRVAARPEVRAIRAKTKLSQAIFAAKLRVPVGTVRDWAQHRRSPNAPARTLLAMVDADPKAALALIVRMGLICGRRVCHFNPAFNAAAKRKGNRCHQARRFHEFFLVRRICAISSIRLV